MYHSDLNKNKAPEKQQPLLREVELHQLMKKARQQRARFIMAKLAALMQKIAPKTQTPKASPHPAQKPM